MMTVKEISDITGVSVRALHYYDEIGLLRPTEKSEAGYRLYDDKALETLQQILFFREFDIPLKEIKAVLDDPALDKNGILRMQRKMLAAKKERIDRLIGSIDEILKGENQMDFAVFTRSELEELCQASIDRMPDFLRQKLEEEFHGLDEWKKHYVERCSREDMQKMYQKMVQWYGDKDNALSAIKNPPGQEVGRAFAGRIEAVEKKLMAKRGLSVDSFDIRELVGELGFVMKRLTQVKDEGGLMRAVAATYRDERQKAMADEKYGAGASEFLAEAIEAFYKNE